MVCDVLLLGPDTCLLLCHEKESTRVVEPGVEAFSFQVTIDALPLYMMASLASHP